MLKGAEGELARRLMTPDATTGIPPLLSGGRPPQLDQDGSVVDEGTPSGIDRLLLTLAARWGPDGQELALCYMRVFVDL